MSNYIVVNNGLLKREKPNTLPIVEFKNYKYDDTIYNKYCKSNEVEVKNNVAAKSRRAGFINTITANHIREAMQYLYENREQPESVLIAGPESQRLFDEALRNEADTRSLPIQDEAYPGVTRETFDLVVPRFEDNPLSQLSVSGTIGEVSRVEDGWVYTIDLARTENLSDSVSTIEYLTPEEMLRRNMITDIEYLDIISERDEQERNNTL